MSRSGVTYPEGFSAAGVSCGLKKNGKPDLAVVLSQTPAVVAGLFTSNVVKGHSLLWSKQQAIQGKARALAINSGCANACVGFDGERDAEIFAQLLAERANCPIEQAFLGSTGVIGYRLDMSKIESGLDQAFSKLSADGGHDASVAVMTTDTYPKEAACEFHIKGLPVRVGGFAKGSGMIHPDLATMISVLTTDISISRCLLEKALRKVADKSFNRVSVDGDTSVCDQVLVLANGMAGNSSIVNEDEDYEAFVSALCSVAVELSKMLARDGEGATKLIEFRVENAQDSLTACTILKSISTSPLVKTAFFGEDANWGRILTAAGYSGAVFDPLKIDIYLGSLLVCKNGSGLNFDEAVALSELKKKEIIVTIDLNSGAISDRMWTCDFSYDYIRINGAYRS